MIGLDTYTLKKLISLLNSEWREIIEDILDQISFFITTYGKFEFEYRFPKFVNLLSSIAVLPAIRGEFFYAFIEKGFDENDASLLEYSIQKSYRIITEDHLMLLEGVTTKQNVIQLIDFFKELSIIDSYFSKHEMIKLVKIFRKWKNITKKKEKRILATINLEKSNLF